MSETVHILVSCPDQALVSNALLVFRTLSVGFPATRPWVWFNGIPKGIQAAVEDLAPEGSRFVQCSTQHDQWVESLVMTGEESFWICDTDMVFFAPVDGWLFDAPIAGRYEPTFDEEWTGTIRVERLHTCLMRIDPKVLRQQMWAWVRRHHPSGFPFNVGAEFIRQHFVPRRERRPLFYDTLAGLFNAIGGDEFSAEQNQCFEHLSCGSYVTAIAPHLKCSGIAQAHTVVWDDPMKAKGIQLEQNKYYDLQRTTVWT